jgi:hypothetical protein
MIEDIDTRVEPRDHAPDGHYGETLLYDLAKFLTTLSLLAMGGILSLTEAAPEGVYRPTWLLLALGAVALGAALSFGVAYSLADARSRHREPSRRLPLALQAATSLLGLGTGGFVWMWWSALA